MKIPTKIHDELWDFCRVNNITNIEEFMIRMLTQGFSIEKYGATPINTIIEKEVEKIVEVPVNIEDVELIEENRILKEENRILKEENRILKEENRILKEENRIKKDIYGEN